MYAAQDADQVLPRWHDWTTSVPDEITTRALFWTMPAAPQLPPAVHEREVLITAAVYAGPAEDGERATASLRKLATPLADISAAMPYRIVQSLFDSFFPKGQLQSYWKSVYLNDIDHAAAAVITRRGNDRPHP